MGGGWLARRVAFPAAGVKHAQLRVGDATYFSHLLEPAAEQNAAIVVPQVRVRLDTPTVLTLSEDRVRSALEYRGSLNRFDLQMSKEAAAALALLFQQIGTPRPLQHISIHISPRPRGSVVRGGGKVDGGAAGAGSGHTTCARLSGERSERSRRNGLVFICDPTTEKECLLRRLLGLPKSQSSLLSKLADTSLLFLFNVRTRQMLGVFAPDGPAGMEIEPKAWGGGGRFPVQVFHTRTSRAHCAHAVSCLSHSACLLCPETPGVPVLVFPPQVRFKPVHPTGHVLQVPESALGEVLRYRNASTRFDLLLRGRAVDKIVTIFTERGTPVGGDTGEVGAPHAGAVYVEADFGGRMLDSTYGDATDYCTPGSGPPQARVPPLPNLPPLPPEVAPLWGESKLGQLPPLPREAPVPTMPPLPPMQPPPDASSETRSPASEVESAGEVGTALNGLSLDGAHGEASSRLSPKSGVEE